jgi:hypothetical protein
LRSLDQGKSGKSGKRSAAVTAAVTPPLLAIVVCTVINESQTRLPFHSTDSASVMRKSLRENTKKPKRLPGG